MSLKTHAVAFGLTALLSLAFSAPAVADAMTSETSAEVEDSRGHDLMVAMMDVFVDALDLSLVQSEALRQTLLARVEADITAFVDQKSHDREQEAILTSLTPEARDVTREFLRSPAGREYFAAASGRRVAISYLTTDEFL